MDYRVENKYIVTDGDLAVIASRLRALMPMDSHQKGSCYEIRSLYFDDLADRCMDENESGIDRREKFRIRIYDPHTDTARLEIKEKTRGLTRKTSCKVSRQEVQEILEDRLPLTLGDRGPFNRLQMEMRCAGLQPKAIIAYERTAFVHPVGNVRVTFDRNIMASRYCDEFFSDRVTGMVPVLPRNIHVLEVKFDELLPDFIAEALELKHLQQTAFSKYYLGRMAVNGEFPVDR